MAKKKSTTKTTLGRERGNARKPRLPKPGPPTPAPVPVPPARKAPGSKAPASPGGFTLCRISSGPHVGKVRLLNVSGQSVSIDGHRTMIRIQIYKNPPPARPPLGPYAAPVDPNDNNYAYPLTAPPIILNNPCGEDGIPVKLTLVIHHIFEPIHGGVVQVLCEKVEKEFACPIATCGPEVT